jgi:hypothetical protein
MAAFAFSATCYTVDMNSRAKGKRAELEAALLLTQMGLKSRRSAQYCGSNGDADLVLDANLHVEVKFQEQMHPYRWMEQAIRDSAKTKRKPIVLCRRTRSPWLVIVQASDLIAVCREVLDGIVRAQVADTHHSIQGTESQREAT